MDIIIHRLNFVWDTNGYFFWLLVVSLFCWTLERSFPWRPGQKAFRKQIGQDIFWLIFNGHFAGLLLAYLGGWLIFQMNPLLGMIKIPPPETIGFLTNSPVWVQFILFFVMKDFMEWCIHNLLHRVSWMWEFHKLHHSIIELDWQLSIPLDGNRHLSNHFLLAFSYAWGERRHNFMDSYYIYVNRSSESKIEKRNKATDSSGLNEKAFWQKFNECVAWDEEVFVYGPPLEQVKKAFNEAGYYHVEMFIALAGKHAELFKQREMENLYLKTLVRPQNLIFTRDQGAAWDLYTIGFYRDIKHFAESADIPAEKVEEAARIAGFAGSNQIGPYLRTLMLLHHDTLAVAIK